MAYEIERGIEMPNVRRATYPLLEMAVGDSVWVPTDKAGGLRSSIVGFSRKSGRKFTTLSTARDGEPGLRAWRVE